MDTNTVFNENCESLLHFSFLVFHLFMYQKISATKFSCNGNLKGIKSNF